MDILNIDNRELCQILNSILFGFLLLWYTKKNKKGKFNQTTLTLSIWFFSSISGILYVFSENSYIGQGKANFYYVFLIFLLFLLFSWPLISLKERTLESYDYDNSNFLKFTCIFISIISILPFTENVIHLFSGNTFEEMGAYHDELIVKSSAKHLSWLGIRLTSIMSWFRYLTPVLFFNYINQKNTNKNKYIICGLLIALINNSVNSFSIGARNIVVQEMSQLLFLYLFMRKTINPKLRKQIVKLSTGFILILVLGITIITIYRFSNSTNETLEESIFRYSGEGFNNLYTDMLYVKTHTYGLHIFRTIFNMTPESLSAITGVRMFVFYTFIGDFIADFDIFGTIIIFSFTSIIIYHTNIRSKKSGFLSLSILSIYADIIISGYMYVPFMNYSTAIPFFLGYIIFYSFISKKKVVSSQK
ncbi:MAG TPA: O-antigen polymerase [Thomasclavelia ramosa]|nr:O-antigen polymerase [Thomasclavelia ramosa]